MNTPCQCCAYKFPHRAGGGKCADPGKKPEGCSECRFAGEQSDPYGTGDSWYRITVCRHPQGDCPWGIA